MSGVDVGVIQHPAFAGRSVQGTFKSIVPRSPRQGGTVTLPLIQGVGADNTQDMGLPGDRADRMLRRPNAHHLAMKTRDLEPTNSDTTGGGRRHGHDPAERPRFDFMASSHDLAEGLDVRDLSDVTIPGDLVDSLFGATK